VDREFLLPAQSQRGAAGDQQLQGWTGRQQFGDLGRGAKDVLEVVEYKQHPSGRDVARQAVHADAVAKVVQTQGTGNDRRHVGGAWSRREIDEGEAAIKGIRQLSRGGDGQACFARTSRAHQRQQPHLRAEQQFSHASDLKLPSNERRRLRGQTDRRKRARHGCQRLCHAHRMTQSRQLLRFPP
jgi:hypothetical protein